MTLLHIKLDHNMLVGIFTLDKVLELFVARDFHSFDLIVPFVFNAAYLCKDNGKNEN